jgi:phospho-N-acetylmuramoyl-pentapeptide-transferase
MFYLIYEIYREAYPRDPASLLRFLRLLGSTPFRAMCAALSAFLLVYFAMPWFIKAMRRRGVSEQERHYSQLNAGLKSTVPTMGGLVFMLAIVVTGLFWCDPTNRFFLIAMAVGICGGLLGMLDDMAKVRRKGSDAGLSRGAKYAGQISIGLALAYVLLSDATSPIAHEHFRDSVYLPFAKRGLDIGWLNLAVVAVFMVFSTNSVNLTDGMDGLATVPSILAFLVLAIFAFIIGDPTYATSLLYFPTGAPGAEVFHNLPGAAELAVLCAAGAGACAGFLWYNAFPATVMMGDTGSLALGALLGAIAVLIRQEVIFLIAGGVFVIEIVTAFVQDYIGLKLLGRRIFFRAPMHSSWLHRGVSESKVTVRLWILSVAFAVAALAMLKLR